MNRLFIHSPHLSTFFFLVCLVFGFFLTLFIVLAVSTHSVLLLLGPKMESLQVCGARVSGGFKDVQGARLPTYKEDGICEVRRLRWGNGEEKGELYRALYDRMGGPREKVEKEGALLMRRIGLSEGAYLLCICEWAFLCFLSMLNTGILTEVGIFSSVVSVTVKYLYTARYR